MIQDKPRQKYFAQIGESGCYFLSILHLAETVLDKYIDAFAAFLLALQKGQVREDCYIVNPSALISDLTGMGWYVSTEAAGYVPHSGELEIIRYEWQEINTLHGHFVVGDGVGRVKYDPYGTSRTVSNGKPVSKRIFRPVV